MINNLPGRIASIESKKRRARERGWLSHAPRDNRGKQGFTTKLYRTWLQMRHRCLNEKAPRAEYYVGRGVTVCEEWQTFENFRSWACEQLRAYEGDRRGISLDRISSDGDYCPENCQFLSVSENSRKSSGALASYSRKLTANQKAQIKALRARGWSGPRLARAFGVQHSSIYRICAGRQ